MKFFKEINTPPQRNRRRAVTNQRNNQNQEEEEEQEVKKDFKGLKGLFRLMMSVRSIDFTYNVGEGTYLPGYTKGLFLFGLDSAFNAPGIPFILGSQNVNIAQEAYQKGWLVNNSEFSNPFNQNNNIDMNINAVVEPVQDFRITLKARKQKTNSFSETYREGNGINTSRNGNYSVT